MKSINSLSALLLAGIFAITISSCKKYDEGGTLGAAKRKIINTWKIDKAFDLEDGKDITNDFNGEIWEFTKDDEYKENGTLKGTYTFSSDKLTLIVLKTDGGSDAFKIIKLKSKEMWLEEVGEEEIHLIPTN